MSGTVLITGGTLGLGYQAALSIAKSHPDDRVVIASRKDTDSASASINKATGHEHTTFLPLDLSSLAATRDFVTEFSKRNFPPIKALVLNAALQFPGDVQTSEDGIEKTVAITHVGHALLFYLIRPRLASDARIVVTSSGVHDPAQKWQFPNAIFPSAEEVFHPNPETANKDGRERYATAKLCNVLWTLALARQLQKGIVGQKKWTVTALDPGLMFGTGLVREYPGVVQFIGNHFPASLLPVVRYLMGQQHVRTPVEGGGDLAALAVGDDFMGISGSYFEGRNKIESSEVSRDESKQDDLYELTIKTIAKGSQEEASFKKVYG